MCANRLRKWATRAARAAAERAWATVAEVLGSAAAIGGASAAMDAGNLDLSRSAVRKL